MPDSSVPRPPFVAEVIGDADMAGYYGIHALILTSCDSEIHCLRL